MPSSAAAPRPLHRWPRRTAALTSGLLRKSSSPPVRYLRRRHHRSRRRRCWTCLPPGAPPWRTDGSSPHCSLVARRHAGPPSTECLSTCHSSGGAAATARLHPHGGGRRRPHRLGAAAGVPRWPHRRRRRRRTRMSGRRRQGGRRRPACRPGRGGGCSGKGEGEEHSQSQGGRWLSGGSFQEGQRPCEMQTGGECLLISHQSTLTPPILSPLAPWPA